MRAGFRTLAKQEYAEDAESCFSASGSCVFDVDAIDGRIAQVRPAVEERAGRGVADLVSKPEQDGSMR